MLMKAEASPPEGLIPPEQKCCRVYTPVLTLGTALLSFAIGFSWLLSVMPQVYVEVACLKE
jgi:hypothetical protein